MCVCLCGCVCVCVLGEGLWSLWQVGAGKPHPYGKAAPESPIFSISIYPQHQRQIPHQHTHTYTHCWFIGKQVEVELLQTVFTPHLHPWSHSQKQSHSLRQLFFFMQMPDLDLDHLLIVFYSFSFQHRAPLVHMETLGDPVHLDSRYTSSLTSGPAWSSHVDFPIWSGYTIGFLPILLFYYDVMWIIIPWEHVRFTFFYISWKPLQSKMVMEFDGRKIKETSVHSRAASTWQLECRSCFTLACVLKRSMLGFPFILELFCRLLRETEVLCWKVLRSLRRKYINICIYNIFSILYFLHS